MSVPTYDKFIEPILRFLASTPSGASAREAHEAAAERLGLTEIDRQEMLPSGAQFIYKNRSGWAHDRLKRAGLSISPRRGYWQLTEKGREYCVKNPLALPSTEIEKLAIGFMDVRLRQPSDLEINNPQDVNAFSTAQLLPLESPDDRLASAIQELRRSVTVELAESLANVSPNYFETIVLDLLHRMGYGASRTDIQRVGGSGDAGIDGVISLDKLGLEKVYVQAKRWQQSVGRPEIQGFYGALAGQRANKGVFITTSEYTQQAKDFAKSVEGIVLIDGTKLRELMMDFEIGISSRTIKVPKLDSDYFDEEST